MLLAVIFSVSCSSKELAPEFTLPDASGKQIDLTSELERHRGVVIVFYRGFF
jgi:peroxiredoxin